MFFSELSDEFTCVQVLFLGRFLGAIKCLNDAEKSRTEARRILLSAFVIC